MKAVKSIFDKSYMIRAQAEKAAAKEFGDAWAEGYELFARPDVMPTRWAVREVATTEPAIHPELAAAELEMPADVVAEQVAAEAAAERQANASMGVAGAQPRLSTAIRPTKLVWEIADTMPKASRKEVMAACVAAGVAYGTARTQYQAWFKASQECERLDIRQPYQKGE